MSYKYAYKKYVNMKAIFVKFEKMYNVYIQNATDLRPYFVEKFHEGIIYHECYSDV